MTSFMHKPSFDIAFYTSMLFVTVAMFGPLFFTGPLLPDNPPAGVANAHYAYALRVLPR